MNRPRLSRNLFHHHYLYILRYILPKISTINQTHRTLISIRILGIGIKHTTGIWFETSISQRSLQLSSFEDSSFQLPQMPDQQQTLSVPSLLLLAAFAALTIRYFFFTQPSTSSSRTNPRAANPADVEQIATMFPQIGRREIIWDLQRNGGSVNATTERILSRGGLDAVGQTATLCLKKPMDFLGHSSMLTSRLFSSHHHLFSPLYQLVLHPALPTRHRVR